MNYPLITEYIDAIRSAEDNFDKLINLRPVLNNDNSPIMSSGNFAVVFKMQDIFNGKLYAVKCFLKEQEGREEAYEKITESLKDNNSSYLASIRYYKNELFVDSNNSSETEFPVLLMDWVEGDTLDKYISKNITSHYAIEYLYKTFSDMSSWLLSQPFAHGDLKPDNIIITDKGNLVLIDYDGMYVPAMKGQKARELGSPDYRHPKRSVEVFDENIDYFSIVIIALSLKAFHLNPSLYSNEYNGDKLLFSEFDYRDIKSSDIIKTLSSYIYDYDFGKLYSLFINSLHQEFSISLLKGVLDSSSKLFTPQLVPYKLKDNKHLIYNSKTQQPAFDTVFCDVDFIDKSLTKSESLIVSIAGRIRDTVPLNEIYDGFVRVTDLVKWEKDKEVPKGKMFAIITKDTKEEDIEYYKRLLVITPYLIIAETLDSKFGFVDSNNKHRSLFKYKKINHVSTDKSSVFICKDSNDKYGILDSELKVIVDFNKEEIYHVNNSAVEPLNIAIYWKQNGYSALNISTLTERKLPNNIERVISYSRGVMVLKIKDNKYILYDFLNEKIINNKEYSLVGEYVDDPNSFFYGTALCQRDSHINIIVDKLGNETIIPFDKKLTQNSDKIFIHREPFKDENKKVRGGSHKFTIFENDKLISSFIYDFDEYGFLTCKVIGNKYLRIGSHSMKYNYEFSIKYYDFFGNPIININPSTNKTIEKNEVNRVNQKDDYSRQRVEEQFINKHYIKGFDYYVSIDVFTNVSIAKVVAIVDVDAEFGVIEEDIGYADANHCYWEY